MQVVDEGKINFNKEPPVKLQLFANHAVCLTIDLGDSGEHIYGISTARRLNQILRNAPGIIVMLDGKTLKRLIHFHELLSADDLLKTTMYPIASINVNKNKTIGVFTHADLPPLLLWDEIEGYENCVQLIKRFNNF